MQMRTSRFPGIRPTQPDPRPASKPAPAPVHDASKTDFVQPNVVQHIRKPETPKAKG
jgi:hypothetical protein